MSLQSRRKYNPLNLVGLVLLGILAAAIFPAFNSVRQMIRDGEVFDAVRDGDATHVRSLLRDGIDPDHEMTGMLMVRHGGTPLYWATCRSRLEVMKVLIEGGANVNFQMADQKDTALMAASTPQAAQLLLAAGADPLLKDAYGQTAGDTIHNRIGIASQALQMSKLLQKAEAKARGKQRELQKLNRR